MLHFSYLVFPFIFLVILFVFLQACFDYDPALFMYLIQPVFKRFENFTVGNKDLIKMFVATVHPEEVGE